MSHNRIVAKLFDEGKLITLEAGYFDGYGNGIDSKGIINAVNILKTQYSVKLVCFFLCQTRQFINERTDRVKAIVEFLNDEWGGSPLIITTKALLHPDQSDSGEESLRGIGEELLSASQPEESGPKSELYTGLVSIQFSRV